MDESRFYLYCFARSGAADRLEAAGVDGRNGVEWMEHDGVAAVISEVAADEFGDEDSQNRAQEPQWVIPRACRHEAVVEEVMARSPVLPARFGAVFSSRERVAKLLSESHAEIARFLDYCSDKQEWAIKGSVALEKASAWLIASDPGLAEQRQRLPGSPGARYLQEKRLASLAKQQLNPLCTHLAEGIVEELRADVVAVRPLSSRFEQDSPNRVQSVLRCAFLVLHSRLADFRARAARCSDGHAEQGLVLEVSGPWPPYSFCPPIGEAQQ